MLLLDLKDYVKEKKSVSLTDLANHFHLPFNVIEDMLETWIKKGLIAKKIPTAEELPACMQSSDCPRCKLKKDPKALVRFEYLK